MVHYRILAAARMLGVSKSTLQYWFRWGMVEDVGRDARGWRVFSDADIRCLRAFLARPRHRAAILGAERRKAIRVGIHLPFEYALRARQRGGASIQGRAVTGNVSRGGLMFRARTAPPVRAAGQFRLSLPEAAGVLGLNGVIRWTQSPARGRRAPVGVAFAPLAPAARRGLTSALYGRWAEQD